MGDLRAAFPGCGIYYALKANPHPLVLRTVADLGCGLEAASWNETELILGLGIEPKRIIYGTAVKPSEHVRLAVGAGIDRFAADAPEEIDLLAALAPGARVFVRTKANDTHSVFHMNGKFGAPVEKAAQLLVRARDRGLVPWGLSFNVGSQATRASVWADGIGALGPVLDELLAADIRLDVLNIGGGFPSVYENHSGPDLQTIAEAVESSLRRLPYRPQLIIEPGRRIAAGAMSLVATVARRVERETTTWLFLNCGVYNALFEALPHQGAFRYPVEMTRQRARSSECRPFTLAGPTGDGLDVIAHDVLLPVDIAEGDRLRFRNAGAYTLALASSFNGFPVPPVHLVETT